MKTYPDGYRLTELGTFAPPGCPIAHDRPSLVE
jgi:hypothetical protein